MSLPFAHLPNAWLLLALLLQVLTYPFFDDYRARPPCGERAR
jgi:hypothetical protein